MIWKFVKNLIYAGHEVGIYQGAALGRETQVGIGQGGIIGRCIDTGV